MLKVTDYVMRFAPVGVFGAVAGAITTQGLGMLGVFGNSCSASTWRWRRCGWCWCSPGYVVLGRDVFRLLELIRTPMLIGFPRPAASLFIPS